MAKCDMFCFSVYFIFTCLLLNVGCVMGQEEAGYGSGAIILTVFLTLLIGVLFEILLYYLWKKYWMARKGKHLILETDPERGKGEYAFDNPGFKDAGLSPLGKSLERLDKTKGEVINKTKWNQWSPLSILSTKSEKKRTQDDSALEDSVKVVSLRSHDFTGLGFNICGNMKDGIFIKDVLHHGPAFESGNLSSGDRINSLTISFEHIVYEDALAILSYASPYDIIISAKNGKSHNYPGQCGRIVHPIFRSSSSADLGQMEKSARKSLFQLDESSEIGSNYSSLQKTRSNFPTLERGKSRSPKPEEEVLKSKIKPPTDLIKNKESLEEVNEVPKLKIEVETQKTENKYHKFGVQVLPLENHEKISPKLVEQNENNINIERTDEVLPITSTDEVDKKQAPPVKRREKINKIQEEKPEPLERQSLLNSSGIKRDENNIPLEIPNDMLNAALMAKKNRISVEEEEIKANKKIKGKAPRPPELEITKDVEVDEIHPVEEINKIQLISKSNESVDSVEKIKPEISSGDIKDYNSDSDIEADNQSSVNTIELNASDITIHQSEENEEKQSSRKTASTGDLTKIQKTRKTSTGALERAQSLDITDTGMPVLTKKRKAAKLDDDIDSKTSSDESLYGSALINKEPRLSLILDGLNTCQRSRLKKSTEWGNLEDAILNLNKQDGSSESFERQNSSIEEFKISNENLIKNFNFGTKSPEFDALVNKINEIKQETIEIINDQEREINKEKLEVTKEEIIEIIEDVPKTMQNMSETIENMPKSIEIVTITKLKTVSNGDVQKAKVKNEIWPSDISNNIETTSEDFKPKSADVIKVENKLPNVIKLETIKKPTVNANLINDFILNEREASCNYVNDFTIKMDDTNISDDIKVSRHSMGSLERQKYEDNDNISNIIITDKDLTSPSYEISFNNKTTKTVLNDFDVNKQETIRNIKNYDNVIVSTPDLIKNITIAEAIHDLNNEVTIEGPTSLTFEIPSLTSNKIEHVKINDEYKTQNGIQFKNNGDIKKFEVPGDSDKTSSLTYITEIQVLTANKNGDKNISEIEVDSVNKILDNDFESYLKNFESNIQNFENNIHSFEQSIHEVEQNVKKEEPKESVSVLIENTDPEKELQKVQEIVEEQLKKLPEMRFTTSSYESQIKPPEKRQSQIEILRSNFEKNSTLNRMARSEISPPKSRIPVLNKTPPTSPERRDSRTLDTEPDKDILEFMSSHIPVPKAANRNVTVTSIRNSSKIPSGLPTLRPPVPPRKIEVDDNHVSKISTNGNVESSFRQWVFNPHDTNSVTNITVTETKYDHK